MADTGPRRGRLPARVAVVVIGAGFAGASTAAAMARRRLGPGVILEREPTPGEHASGRNAALSVLVEDDPDVARLALQSARWMGELRAGDAPVLRRTGGVHLADPAGRADLEALAAELGRVGVERHLLDRASACARFPWLGGLAFDAGLWSPGDGVIDIHALLSHYLREARDGGFPLVTRCAVHEVLTSVGRVCGVATNLGEVRADVVVDAGGAWAGRFAAGAPLALQPRRRHLFVSGPAPVPRDAPYVWDAEAAYYFRPEGDGLLLSPCDQTEHPPEPPSSDPAALTLLAEKLTRRAPGLADLAIRSGWACLRTFAADRRPVVGADPRVPGLFYVAGLGGFGAGTSYAVGELAASLVRSGGAHALDARRLIV